MSGIVLSSSVRQNLLSLQSTADLLATTQNRLATGKKVNTALDNPTNFFTAQSLDARASDINNLLDGIGNGVQVLQAANTGITSLQKLVDTAKSIANQALQSAVGYSTKSNVSATITGATAADLRGTTSYTSATATSNVLFSGAAGGTTAAVVGTTLGGTSASLVGTAAADGAGTAASLAFGLTLAGAPSATTIAANGAPSDGETLTVNGKTITFKSGSVPAAAAVPAGSGVCGNIVTDGNGNSTVYIGTTGTPTGDGAGSGERHRPRQRRPEGRQRRRRGDALQLLGHQRRDRGRRSYLDDRYRCGSQHHRQGRPPECARPDRVGRLRRRHGYPAAHDHDCVAWHAGAGRLDAERQRQDHHVQERCRLRWLRTSRRVQASAVTSSPTAAAIRPSICRARRSPIR